ncbi:tetraacyldisaccharide 4'-kinase [Photobacterium aphoticum]|uniref:Tetraacyldisaccharide 4'-kinase n=1 Tax=Photobacterium aphoticum TaxID=754436 RepID=A0A0J1GN71_9GAMM|nr:tetraacyldisaccharide 4'-kinase [Photobacterium aphoticum]KLV01061.1 tetraacyldisaccharide 4'-kinase [Photobacterium aphoticum]PSU58383.1 tetraacyldisaccharide 4'-kinase [Photobacterium aphoticum]GHA37552.1 tetraacyldisaccharide 4'-kinase [Photobacterium aphoticum]
MASIVEKMWFESHPLGWVLSPVLWPLSKLFGLISRRRRQQYQSGQKAVYRAKVPVIVVGNITAGGNGKTPVVVWLVEQLLAKGLKPGVVSRGYGAKAPHYPYRVTDSSTTAEAGDEPVLIYRRTGVPVAVSPVRADAVAMLESEVDVIITDDGLQHYALARDIEIVVIDGQRRFGNQQLIPAGPLREGCERLQEVDFLICNGGDAQAGEIPMHLAPSALINLQSGARCEANTLNGDVVAMAGIGHPPRFFNTLASLGVQPVVCQPFADHKAFSEQELHQLSARGQHLLMTEKDAVKCHTFALPNWWYLPVDAVLPPEQAERLINRIIKVKEEYGSSSA